MPAVYTNTDKNDMFAHHVCTVNGIKRDQNVTRIYQNKIFKRFIYFFIFSFIYIFVILILAMSKYPEYSERGAKWAQ